MAKKLFVSYRADNEGTKYKNLLVAWSKNDSGHFDIKFDDSSVGVSINSTNANYIKQVIKGKISDSPTFLLLIGKDTHNSEWVSWEIEQAKALNKKLVAVKIDKDYTSPSEILNSGASWAMSFTYDAIKKAIDN
ncbi:TIR domain-containing protein [Solibacillus sp. FSL R7-0682]|uniref:TIR domain-containing protein n=1 Tax=Solibacillus sp. FSL R7-0682 TaxID=2921690 RepID=UPI0030FA057A